MNRYFPELDLPLLATLSDRCVLDGEVVIVGPSGMDCEALLLRIHPSVFQVAMLAQHTSAFYVVWDLLALGDSTCVIDLRRSDVAFWRRR